MTTARSPLLPIQTALYEAMTDDADLTGLLATSIDGGGPGVFDEVPEGQPKPYVVLGEAIGTPRNNHGQYGRETVETLHIWSDHKGYSEALNILNSLIELFDHQTLVVDGQHVVSVRYEFDQTLRDPDPDIRHVIVRFRVTTEQTALDDDS